MSDTLTGSRRSTPSTPLWPPSRTRRSTARSPSSAWSRTCRSAPTAPVRVEVYLTVAGCPMRETITDRVTSAVSAVPGVTAVQVGLDVMSDEQRAELRKTVRGTDAAEPVIPFAQPGSLTRVYAVASGKGGVGKSQRHGQPGRGAGQARAVGRRRRRRHLRPLGAAHARRRRQADPGRLHDHAAAGPRREGHLDRHVHPGQHPGGLARADAAPRAAAVPRRRLLGRPRRAAARPAAGHRRRRDLGGPAGAQRRDPRGDDAAARRRRGGRAGRRDRHARPTSRSSAWSRTCPGWSCPTARAWRSSAPAAARPSPTR